MLVVGCDEVDETDVLLCDLSTETILKAAEDDALGPDGFTPADATYASLQLEACWRRHGDGISTIRCGGGATAGWKPFVRLARALRGSLFDGTDQDGLDVALGRKAPAQLVRGADERTYAWERVHLTYAKTVGVSLVAAGALRLAAPSASCMEILKQGVVAAVLGVVSVNVHRSDFGPCWFLRGSPVRRRSKAAGATCPPDHHASAGAVRLLLDPAAVQ